MSIFEHLDQKKSVLKRTLHPKNNPIINTVIENKIKMIEWFQNIILGQQTQTDLKKIEKILIDKRNYYVNKRKSSMKRQDTFDNDDNIEMIEWFLFLFRNRIVISLD